MEQIISRFHVNFFGGVPSLKLTAKAPENGWLEYYFPIGFRPIFRGELLVSGRVVPTLSQGYGLPEYSNRENAGCLPSTF